MAPGCFNCGGGMSTSNSAQFPKFFATVDPADHGLQIPAEFIKRFGQKLPDNVTLKVAIGQIKKVGLVHSNGETWLYKGWKEFKEFYSIGFSHALVFEYDGISHFNVNIFDKNGVEIEYPHDYVNDDGEIFDHNRMIKSEPSDLGNSQLFGINGCQPEMRRCLVEDSKAEVKTCGIMFNSENAILDCKNSNATIGKSDARVQSFEMQTWTDALLKKFTGEVEINLLTGDYNDLNECFEAYNQYAYGIGFSVRKGKQYYFLGTRDPKIKWYFCSCEGFRDDKSSAASTSNKFDSRTECEAKISFEKREDGIWKVTNFVTKHNHDLALPHERHLLRSHRRIKKSSGDLWDTIVSKSRPHKEANDIIWKHLTDANEELDRFLQQKNLDEFPVDGKSETSFSYEKGKGGNSDVGLNLPREPRCVRQRLENVGE